MTSEATPGIGQRIWYRLGFHIKGWVDCPDHGWTFDPLTHGYRNGCYYHRCQAKGCEYTVLFL